MCSITWWHFQWPRRTLTRFTRSQHFWSRISQERCILGTKLLRNTNRKWYTIYRMIPLSWPWVTFDPHFKVTTFLKSNILKTKLLLHNRKLYLTYGMVLLFGDLDWPPNASSRFVSISWASCWNKQVNLDDSENNNLILTLNLSLDQCWA